MDDLGIGAAALGAFRCIVQTLRGTGRTARQVERYQSGDRMVFIDQEHARHFLQRLKAVKPHVALDYHVVNPRDPQALFSMPRGTPRGRMIFDHAWLEAYYDNVLNTAMEQVRWMQDQTSGRGEPHRITHDAYLSDRFRGWA